MMGYQMMRSCGARTEMGLGDGSTPKRSMNIPRAARLLASFT
jgi:hypothetical protein